VRFPTGYSANGEIAQSLGLLVTYLDVLHDGSSGTLLREGNEAFDAVGRAFEHSLDGSVRPVLCPPGHTVPVGQAAQGVPEEDALHGSVDDDSLPHRE
jgi:hypothetical protein